MQTAKVTEHIVAWLKEYATKANCKGFVIGISGGIDSAVTSTLCAKTGMTTLCVEMPIHQNQSQEIRGKTHIEWLKNSFENVDSLAVDLSETFDALSGVLPQTSNFERRDLSLANTRARLRMTSLYYMAGIRGFLVAGTGNKVEDFGVGFYTKYGDGGVDLSPIADLLKSEVKELASYLSIDSSVVNAAPTDGLWGDDRTDEDQLGATYLELEWAMQKYDLNEPAENFVGREREVFEIYTKLHRSNLHKMRPVPICIIEKELRNNVN